MVVRIQEIEKQFKDIDKLVNTQAYGIQLKDNNFITSLSTLVEEAYFSLNVVMCEEVNMCNTCSYQRNYMRNIMGVLNEVEETKTLSAAVKRELFTFPEKVKEVLSRIDKVLKEI